MKQARKIHLYPRLFHLIWLSRILAKQIEAFWRQFSERAIRNPRDSLQIFPSRVSDG
jgi:hypothetical protein